jgi:hypothetical protein
MPALGAVRRVTAGEMMAFNDAFETAAFGDADGVNVIARSKERRAENVARLHFFAEVPKFLDAFNRDAVMFLDVPEHGLREALFFLVVEPELDGVVTVGLLGFALQNAIGARKNDGHGGDLALGAVNARLAQFFSE